MPQRAIFLARFAVLLLGAMAGHASAQSAAFRVDTLALRDPHLFVSLLGCNDVTATFNDRVQAQLQADDSPADGNFDLSWLIAFTPLDLAAPSNPMQFGRATCTADPIAPSCTPPDAGLGGEALLSTVATCLATIPGSVRPYAPVVPTVVPTCFASPAATFEIDLGLLSIPLHDAQIAGTFVAGMGDAPAALASGLLRGFLTQTDAEATVLPADLPLIGGRTLASLLPGGSGNCAAHSDMDQHAGQQGWWMYLQYSAVEATLDTPDPHVFGDGFEA